MGKCKARGSSPERDCEKSRDVESTVQKLEWFFDRGLAQFPAADNPADGVLRRGLSRSQIAQKHPDRNARMHNAWRRGKQVAYAVEGQRRDRITMTCLVQLRDVPVCELDARRARTHGFGNAQVLARRNTPGNAR